MRVTAADVTNIINFLTTYGDLMINTTSAPVPTVSIRDLDFVDKKKAVMHVYCLAFVTNEKIRCFTALKDARGKQTKSADKIN